MAKKVVGGEDGFEKLLEVLRSEQPGDETDLDWWYENIIHEVANARDTYKKRCVGSE